MNIVILAGGIGQRLWPMSTAEKPKQFQKLISERSMLQETYDRLKFIPKSKIYVSSNAHFKEMIQEQLPEIPEENLILEPSRQDTAPGIGLIAAEIAKKDPNAVIAIVYADHLVQDQEEFRKKLSVACELAKKDRVLSIIEVKAKSPNVNLGYVKIGKMLEERHGIGVYQFKAFKEKPDLKTAKRFMDSYDYLWNTGYYVFRADFILEAFQKHLPETYEILMKIQAGGSLKELYPKCQKISIDYGVMEKLDPKEVRIIPADLGWSDIGTWESLFEELCTDPKANLKKGKIHDFESEGSVLYNDSEDQILIFGAKNMVVVKSEGKILVCPKDKTNELKRVLDALSD